MPTGADLLQLLHRVHTRLDGDMSLDAWGRHAGWSPFHLHRAFSRLAHETPKQYTQRLRLDRAAAELVTGDRRVIDVALAHGFASHAVFTRAFRRRYGRTPQQFRAALTASTAEARARHALHAVGASPCLGLYHLSLDRGAPATAIRRVSVATSAVTRVALQPQPVLLVRQRIARPGIAATIADSLGKVFVHLGQAGLAVAGRPFSRYPDVGPGLMTIECGVPIATAGTGGGEVEAVTLPGGPAAFALHSGTYDTLHETYAAIERWIEASGARVGGAPWESYITDPAEFPNPDDWKTEVYWPLES